MPSHSSLFSACKSRDVYNRLLLRCPCRRYDCVSISMPNIHCRSDRVVHSLFDPPRPPPPPSSPMPLTPPFLATGGNLSFAGCTDECDVPDTELLCRDGGRGSFLPALCAYGSQCSRCGVRIDRETIGSTVTLLRSVEQLVDGDNSCPYAYDGLCQDGRASTPEKPTEFVFIDPQTSTHLCPYLTDKYARSNVSNPFVLCTPFSATSHVGCVRVCVLAGTTVARGRFRAWKRRHSPTCHVRPFHVLLPRPHRFPLRPHRHSRRVEPVVPTTAFGRLRPPPTTQTCDSARMED